MFLRKAQRLVLSAPSDVIRKIIDIIEFDKIVPAFPSADAAKEFIRASTTIASTYEGMVEGKETI